MRNVFTLNRLCGMAMALVASFHGVDAVALPIADTYYGGNDHGYGDRIGGPIFEVQGASIARTGTTVTVDVFTNLAGHADEKLYPAYTNRAPSKLNGVSMGIGYGDLFLSTAWKPFGSDVHHVHDNAANGTHWTYAFALGDDRWTDAGGAGALYALNGATNDANALLAEDFLSGATYRNGQEVAVDRASSTVTRLANAANWSVAQTPNAGHLHFVFDVTGTALATSEYIALHWGMACGNDVVEGQQYVSEPASLTLAITGLAGYWRRNKQRPQRAFV
jgi:hypothetical protein